MLRRNPSRIFGNASSNTSRSKKASFTEGHPGEFTMRIAATVKKITVLATATQTLRCSVPPPKIRERRWFALRRGSSPVSGGARVAQPWLPPTSAAYENVGTLVSTSSHSSFSASSVPSSLKAWIAVSTHGVSALPFSNVRPNCSCSPRSGN